MIDAGLVIVGSCDAALAWPVSFACDTTRMRSESVKVPRMRMSLAPLLSPPARLVASVSKTTYSPSSFDAGLVDGPLPALPPAVAEMSSVSRADLHLLLALLAFEMR